MKVTNDNINYKKVSEAEQYTFNLLNILIFETARV